jgi:hypothetical protein
MQLSVIKLRYKNCADNGAKEKWHRRMLEWLRHMSLKVLKVYGYILK